MFTIFLIVLLLCLSWWCFSRKTPGMPPGPTGLPIVGYLPFINPARPELTFIELSKKYGNIITVRMGKYDCVVVDDFDLLRKLFSLSESTGRPNIPAFKIFSNNPNRPEGVVSTDGHVWQELRRFSMRHLKDLGVKSNTLNDVIMIEVDQFLHQLHLQTGKPLDFASELQVSVFNIIWNMLTGKRAASEDPDFIHIMNSVNKNVEALLPAIFLSLLSDTLYNLVPGCFYDYKRMKQVANWFRDYALNMYREIQTTYDPKQMRHMIDYFTAEMKREEKGEDNLYTEDELVGVLGDLMVAGAETSATTIKFATLYLIHYPTIQERLYMDIEREIGTERRINMEDKIKLPYLEAFILEVQRVANIVPLAIFHRLTGTVNLHTYTIPKDTLIIPNLEAIHNDPKYWEDPHVFNPDRFIDENGCAVPNREGFAAFSLGKRRCIGEVLARAELFLFLGNMIQEFSIEAPPGKKPPPIERIPGMVIHPGPFQCVFRSRVE